MEFKIGYIPKGFGSGNEGHKYIVVKEGTCYIYHADMRGDLGLLNYSGLVSKFNVQDIVCSGLVDHSGRGRSFLGIWSGPLENEVEINGNIYRLKGASRTFMKNFENLLIDAYKKICPDLREVENNCNPNI